MGLKLFAKNAVIYAIGNITLRASSFLLVPLYTHYLSVEDYGRLETLFVTIWILLIFMGLGMQSSVIRFYKENEDTGEISKLLGTSLTVIGIGIFTFSLVFVLAFGSFFRNLLHSELGGILIILVCFVATVECLTTYFMAIARAKNNARKFASAAVSIAMLIILLTVLFLPLFKQGLPGVLTARALGYTTIGSVLAFGVLRHTSVHFSKAKVREVFSFGFPLIFAASGWFILDASDRYFLAHFWGMGEVGIYALGYKLTFILLAIVVMPFELAYGPYVFANMKHPGFKKAMSRLFTYLVLTLVIVGYLIVLFSRDIINLMAPEEYKSAYLVTICVLPASAFSGIIYWASAQLHIVKKTYYIAVVIIGAALLNLLLNYMLIPKHGWFGAAIATNISFLFASGVVLVLGQLSFPVKFEFRRLILAAIIFIILCLSYVFTNKLNVVFYYGFNCIILSMTPIILYRIGFFDTREKQFIGDVLSLRTIRQ